MYLCGKLSGLCSSENLRICSHFIRHFPLFGRAQSPNNWINFAQPYYRMPVAKAGIYRLTYNDLQSAGIPVGAVDPRFLQVFHRGVEQAIIVQGQADAQLNQGDYLEFYGERNDGTRDALYISPLHCSRMLTIISSATPQPIF